MKLLDIPGENERLSHLRSAHAQVAIYLSFSLCSERVGEDYDRDERNRLYRESTRLQAEIDRERIRLGLNPSHEYRA